MWTDYSIMGKFETGRVYVVYQDKNVSTREVYMVSQDKSVSKGGVYVVFEGKNRSTDCGILGGLPGHENKYRVGDFRLSTRTKMYRGSLPGQECNCSE
jgi:hypothetical protein